MKKILLALIGLIVVTVLLVGCSSNTANEEPTGKTGNGDKITINQLAKIAPGAGVQMMEIGNRYWTLFYAAKDGNWELAEYEIDELQEAMEVVEVTRPGKKDALESWTDTFAKPIENAIKKKNEKDFESAFNKGADGCNACHTGTKKDFIEWKLPAERPPVLQTKAVK